MRHWEQLWKCCGCVCSTQPVATIGGTRKLLPGKRSALFIDAAPKMSRLESTASTARALCTTPRGRLNYYPQIRGCSRLGYNRLHSSRGGRWARPISSAFVKLRRGVHSIRVCCIVYRTHVSLAVIAGNSCTRVNRRSGPSVRRVPDLHLGEARPAAARPTASDSTPCR